RGRCRGDYAGKHLLNHRRRLTEHADAGGDVDAEHDPEKPELRGLDGLSRSDIGGMTFSARRCAENLFTVLGSPLRGGRLSCAQRCYGALALLRFSTKRWLPVLTGHSH